MNLTINLPSQVFAEMSNVARLVVQTPDGAWGILPNRQDCVAVLVPGIMQFESHEAGIAYVAVDVGLLVKTGPDVQVSVRRAALSSDLASLRETLEREYTVVGETERQVRHVSQKLETGFMQRLVALRDA